MTATVCYIDDKNGVHFAHAHFSFFSHNQKTQKTAKATENTSIQREHTDKRQTKSQENKYINVQI